jgi:ABC-type phosphate/phosphonate transport system permease subunit
MKRTAITTLVCGIVFGTLATWLGPKMIAYWYAPPVPNAFNCTNEVVYAMHRLVSTQLIGTAIGLVVGLVLGIALRRKHPEEAELPAASTTPGAGTTTATTTTATTPKP